MANVQGVRPINLTSLRAELASVQGVRPINLTSLRAEWTITWVEESIQKTSHVDDENLVRSIQCGMNANLQQQGQNYAKQITSSYMILHQYYMTFVFSIFSFKLNIFQRIQGTVCV